MFHDCAFDLTTAIRQARMEAKLAEARLHPLYNVIDFFKEYELTPNVDALDALQREADSALEKLDDVKKAIEVVARFASKENVTQAKPNEEGT